MEIVNKSIVKLFQLQKYRILLFNYTNFSTLGVVAVVVSGSESDPGDALVPVKPRVTPIPTVTIFVTPSPSPTK